jgi:hypothetical protein
MLASRAPVVSGPFHDAVAASVPGPADTRAVRLNQFRERDTFYYGVEYAWPGMPSKTKLVDLGRPVEVGQHIKQDRLWWRVERVEPPGLHEVHLGRVTATASTL